MNDLVELVWAGITLQKGLNDAELLRRQHPLLWENELEDGVVREVVPIDELAGYIAIGPEGKDLRYDPNRLLKVRIDSCPLRFPLDVVLRYCLVTAMLEFCRQKFSLRLDRQRPGFSAALLVDVCFWFPIKIPPPLVREWSKCSIRRHGAPVTHRRKTTRTIKWIRVRSIANC